MEVLRAEVLEWYSRGCIVLPVWGLGQNKKSLQVMD